MLQRCATGCRGRSSGIGCAGLGMLCGDLLEGQYPDPRLPMEPSQLAGLQWCNSEVVGRMVQGGLTASKGPSSSRPILFTSETG